MKKYVQVQNNTKNNYTVNGLKNQINYTLEKS